jgi:hypothetical protein
VLVLLDERTISSRQMSQVLRHAEKLIKPVIPVLLEQLPLPLALVDVVPLDWTDPTQRTAEPLLRAVRSTLPRSANERGEQAPSMTSAPLLYLTYSREDAAVAQRVSADLSGQGITTWLDLDRLAAGQDWRAQAQEALDRADAVVVLMSPALRKNKYAAQEITYALRRDKRIFPLQIAPIDPTDVPLELADLHLVDATEPWSYQKAIHDVGRLEIVWRQITDIAEEYQRVRQSMPSGPERTRRMEVVASRMRTLAQAAFPLLPQLMKRTEPGMTLAALTALQAVPDVRYLEWIAEQVGHEQPFIGYHAAVALLAGARELPERGLGELEAALTRAETYASRKFRPDADRSLTLRDTWAELDRRRRGAH